MANATTDVELGNIQDPTVQFLLHFTQNHTNNNNNFSPSIHMIPSRIRDLDPTSFNPRVVSIGPLHRKEEHLLAFEGQKAVFLRDLLLHSGSSSEQTLETCVHSVNASIDRIRACYEDRIESYSDDEIARMMVTDACFILEFLHKLSTNEIFDPNMLFEPSMVFDLLMIENQIPYFILEDIFECTCSRFTEADSLNELILELLQKVSIFEESGLTTIKNDDEEAHDHILGLLHKCYQPSDPPASYWSNSTIFHSAVELDRAGVNFKPHHRDPQWLMAIELESTTCFWGWGWAKPTVRMPVLCIHDCTELVLRNLIVYEQFSPQVHNYVTSYVAAMDLLINNAEDVAMLVESKVIANIIGSNDEAANMINHLGKEAPFIDFFYAVQWEELNKYYDGYWPKNIAWLRRTYFNSPWNIIALLAGIFLFVLTVVQTYFTINPMS